MNFLEEFAKRGYLYQCTDLEALGETLRSKSIGFYVGFDCTAKSLHVGNLMQIMILRLVQKHGFRPIVIVGGATSRIGDPSGKDEARKALSKEDIEQNIDGIKKSLSKFINFGEGPNDAIILNNSSWLDSVGYLDFLSTYGREFSISRMLSMDSVRLRLEREQNLTFLEFNYMLLQAYDFMHLAANHNCLVQLGGSDQWGNIVMGTELIRKKLNKVAFGLTTPLLTTSSGAKMGKSVNGAIWLNEDLLSPYDYYQYWRNTEDADLVKFSRLYAEFSDQSQEEFEALARIDINGAKKELAFKLTSLCHGLEAAMEARETSRKVFEQGGIGESLPEFLVSENTLKEGVSLSELIFITGLTTSKSEAKKLIKGGGAKLNNIKVEDESTLVYTNDLTEEGFIKISAGKKRHALIRVGV
ncbi:MAG: tyrosine--tRNA ligase [Rickettsiaceae bacterium]|nr:tyrosine--tRNA ligase [Rickettsiaceae bacterium]